MTDTEWKVFFAGVKKRSAEMVAKLKLRPGVTVCPECDAPQLGNECPRCGKKACYGYGDLCCKCCDIEAEEFMRRMP